MSIVYFGTAEFAVPALEAVVSHVSLVVSQPDRLGGRGMKPQVSPVKKKALELGLEVATPEKARAPEFVARIASLAPELLLVAAYGQILSSSLLETGRNGGINLHGSVLPKYRGAAPIQRAIFDGETETGVTLMQMDRGMDTGDIIAIARLAIGSEETYGELAQRLGELAGDMAKRWLPQLLSGAYTRQPQENEQATMAPKVSKEEAQLQFRSPAQLEYNRFRAFYPSPGPFLITSVGRLKIGAARLSGVIGEPGTIVGPDTVAFEEGSIQLIEVQPEGKKRMSGRDFVNGYRLGIGQSIAP